MKKRILPLILSTFIFSIHPLSAMDQDTEESERKVPVRPLHTEEIEPSLLRAYFRNIPVKIYNYVSQALNFRGLLNEAILFLKILHISHSSFYITATDKKNFQIIQSYNNLVPTTNAHLDEIGLTGPLKVELAWNKYLRLIKCKVRKNHAAMFIGVLQNGNKVLIKRPLSLYDSQIRIHREYSIEHAIREWVAPKIARAYFKVPTLPPTELILLPNNQFELRQFFIEGALPEKKDDNHLAMLRQTLPYLLPWNYRNPMLKNVELDIVNILHPYAWPSLSTESVFFRQLLYTPRTFNRGEAFLFELGLFEDFTATADRNPSQYLWIPPHKREKKWAFMSIDYAETCFSMKRSYYKEGQFYEYYCPGINKDIENYPFDFYINLPPIAPLSALRKLEYLQKIFPTFFTKAQPYMTQLEPAIYFSVFKEWHNRLLRSYEGKAFDDRSAAFGIMVNSHKLNE